MIDRVARLWYELRWWRWFVSSAPPMRTLFGGPCILDRESARIILERHYRQWVASEPKFRGEYPKRKGGLCDLN